MPDRVVREALLTSPRWASLRLHLQNFYLRLLLVADDYGTFPANPTVIHARCYTLEMGRVREADLARWLEEIELAGLIRLWEHPSGRFLTVLRFGQAERLQRPRARYPRPEAGGVPDAPGQGFMPFADEGPPGRTPSYSQAPDRGDFSASKPLKRREEKSPHSPPPAGGGKMLSLPGPAAEAPRARTPRRFRSPQRAQEQVTKLQAEIARIREEMRDLYHPGGCALRVMPTGEKAAKADRLRARWDACEKEIERLETANTPEKTGADARRAEEVGE